MTRQNFLPANIVALAVLVAGMMFLNSTFSAAQTETVLHAFQSTSKMDGSLPVSTLIADSRGALYGTTRQGGKYGFGNVFKLVPPATLGGAWKENILYSFTGGTDGGNPWFGSLLLNPQTGVLYGTTSAGGSANAGVVYKLTPGKPWSETVLYSFTGGADGNAPSSGVIQGSNGVLYGTTFIGGINNQGVVYRLAPPRQQGSSWKEAVLYAFKAGVTDGYLPIFGLTLDSAGALYGATAGGGGANSGCVFKLTPQSGGAWTENILYFFNGTTDGGEANSGVVFDSTGALYGATGSNGVQNGNVYQLTPPSVTGGAWTENVLHVFAGSPNDGAVPTGVIFDSTGTLFGTTAEGGSFNTCCNGWGTIFKLSPPSTQGGQWTEQVLYSFQGGTDGAGPNAPLLLRGGTFYGTTVIGGSPNVGTVFTFTP